MRDERLCVADGAGQALDVLAVGIGRGDLDALELTLDHESDVLDGLPLPLRVPQHRERGLARAAHDREHVAAESGGLRQVADLTARIALDLGLSAGNGLPGDGQVLLAQCEPDPRETHRRVQVGHCVQLHGRAVPAPLDRAPQLWRQQRRLVGVPNDDFQVGVFCLDHLWSLSTLSAALAQLSSRKRKGLSESCTPERPVLHGSGTRVL